MPDCHMTLKSTSLKAPYFYFHLICISTFKIKWQAKSIHGLTEVYLKFSSHFPFLKPSHGSPQSTGQKPKRGLYQLSPACFPNIFSCHSLLCLYASAILNYIQFQIELISVSETIFPLVPVSASPSTFPAVICFEKPSLTFFTQQSDGTERASLGSKNMSARPSYNTNLSQLWQLLYLLYLIGLSYRL